MYRPEDARSRLEEFQPTRKGVSPELVRIQRAHHGLTKGYTLKYMRIPNVIWGIFLNYAMLGSLGMSDFPLQHFAGFDSRP